MKNKTELPPSSAFENDLNFPTLEEAKKLVKPGFYETLLAKLKPKKAPEEKK